MALNHIQITNAKPRGKAYKVADSDGLYLVVQTNGTKLSRMNYRHSGWQKTRHADRQRLYRKLQRQVPGGVPEPALVHEPRRRGL